jgi:hypothetical protein
MIKNFAKINKHTSESELITSKDAIEDSLYNSLTKEQRKI